MSEQDDIVIKIGSSEESKLVEELCKSFPEAMEENSRMVKFLAECSLRNRDYNMESANKRLGKYISWRKDTFGHLSDQSIENNDILKAQIQAGLIYTCPTKLPNGTALLFVRMRHHDPSTFDAITTLKYWHYMILCSLIKDPSLASTGFVFVNNFDGASLSNTDINLPRIISAALNKCMPIRVSSISLVNPPWVLRMVIPIFKSVLSAKLSERVNVVPTNDELPAVLDIPQELLPTELGGQVEVSSKEGHLQVVINENILV